MASITIYHNPRCSNSRNTLALIRHAGLEPVCVDYLSAPPSSETLLELAAASGLGLRGLLREKEPEYAALGLDRAGEDALLQALRRHPQLLNRPIVVSPLGTALCRPPETVLELLPVPGPLPDFHKEDGSLVRDDGKRRPA